MADVRAKGLLCLFAICLVSCGGSPHNEKQLDPDGGSILDSFASPVLGSRNQLKQPNFDGFFKDEMDFTIDELRTGATNCSDIIEASDLKSRLHPWPSALKEFLIDELKQFEAAPLLNLSLYGIYLVDTEIMTNPETGTSAGIACDRGGDYKGLVFLNHDSFIRDRTKGVGTWQDLHVVTNQYIIQDAGDNAAATLIHELIHTIDNKLLVHGDKTARDLRSKIFEMSWQNFTTPKSARIGIFFLNENDNPIESMSKGLKQSGTGCNRKFAARSPDEQNAPSDTSARPEDLAGDLRYLAERTNFIVPYSMASAAEDFAESMTVYHFGLKRDSWQIRTVYASAVTPRTRESTKSLYRHDTESIIKSAPTHMAKICAMADLLFGKCDL